MAIHLHLPFVVGFMGRIVHCHLFSRRDIPPGDQCYFVAKPEIRVARMVRE